MSANFRLSIAVPVRNEETVLPELLSRTRAVLAIWVMAVMIGVYAAL